MRKIILLAALLGISAALLAQQTGSFTLKISGQKTWSISYGIGDPEALSWAGVRPGQLSLDQSLQAKISGTALGFITLEADFNDKLGTGFQHLVLMLDKDPWHGLVGDFRIGQGELGVYNKKLLGAKLEYRGDGFTAGALAARLEGISQSVTFHGKTSQAEVTFAYTDPERPWLKAPYLKNLDGLYFWQLERPYIEGFSQVKMELVPGEALRGFLADYGLNYLYGEIQKDPSWELAKGVYLVLQDAGEVLLLKSDPYALLRERVRKAIDAYNSDQGLTDDERKTYPFVQGSELEAAFLKGLAAYSQLVVDEVDYPLSQAGSRGYLFLGEKNISEESLEVEVKPPSGSGFISLPDPSLPGYRYSLYPEQGILKIDFPADFFGSGAALKVKFQYQRAGNSFMLGLSVVPGSERVYLNGKLLKRGTDYTIDYDVGLLVLFTPLKEEDVLKVDFERQRGGLGGYSPYERVFFGATFSLPGYQNLRTSVWRAMDLGHPDPTTPTMPNDHTVAGLSMSGMAGGWDYTLSAGFSDNVFPPGDNQRPALPNEINAIAEFAAPDGDYIVFAHANGLTVFHDGQFSSYGGAQGLGGREVRDVIALPGKLLCATDAGLTIVDTEEADPLDRVANWHRLYKEDGFPGKEGLALAAAGGKVFLATDEVVAVFAIQDAANPKNWQEIPLPELEGEGKERPRVLLAAGGRLYLGGEGGVYQLSGDSWRALPDVVGPVNDLLEHEGTLYVATSDGIRLVRDGRGAGWLVAGEAVYSLALFQEHLWWGSETGVYEEGSQGPAVDSPVTALAALQDALWAGGRADEDYVLSIWRLAPEKQEFPPTATHIDGRDLGHFQDAAAASHTARGPMGSLVLRRKLGNWDLALNFSTLWPGYQPIGGAGGSDSHGLTLTASYKDDKHTVRLEGGWHIVELMSSPRSKLSGSLTVSWAGAPNLSLKLSPVYEAGVFKAGYGAAAAWKGDDWALHLSLGGNLTGPSWQLAGRLNGDFSWQPSSALKLTARLVRPFRSFSRAGDEELQGTLNWSGKGNQVTISASLTGELRHRVFQNEWIGSATGRLDLRWNPWPLGSGRLSPRTILTANLSSQKKSWKVQNTGQLKLGDESVSFGATFGEEYFARNDLVPRTISLNFRWEPAGWSGIKLTLTGKYSWRILRQGSRVEKVIRSGEATLRVSLNPSAPWSDNLTFELKDDGSWRLTNRFSWPLEKGTLLVQTSARLDGKGRLEGKVVGSYGQPVAKGWDISAEAGYAFGGSVKDKIGQGLFGRLSLIASF